MLRIILFTFMWFLLALIIGASGLLASIPPPFPQAVLVSIVVLLLIFFGKSGFFREWSLTVDMRILLLIHLTRFVGIYFLILYSRGELPYDFAVPGGWGDIIVAATAFLVLLFSPTSGFLGFVIYFIWNLFGFIDILLVVMTAGRLAIADPQSMIAITKLPLNLLLTFLVPIIIYSHIVIIIRLWRSKNKGYRTF
ncbi:MAG TPA: hypothetical protein VGA95_10870 [Thermodesulfobacteriota bacterium]